MPATHRPDEKTKRQVTMMAGIGTRREDIARIIGIDMKTLERHYHQELEGAKAVLNAQVASNLYRIATSSEKGAVAAAIFWMKTRARWKETIDLSNDDGSMKPETVQLAVMTALKKTHDKD